MGRAEPDLAKRAKLDALRLTAEEWVRVKLFLGLLGVCFQFFFREIYHTYLLCSAC